MRSDCDDGYHGTTMGFKLASVGSWEVFSAGLSGAGMGLSEGCSGFVRQFFISTPRGEGGFIVRGLARVPGAGLAESCMLGRLSACPTAGAEADCCGAP